MFLFFPIDDDLPVVVFFAPAASVGDKEEGTRGEFLMRVRRALGCGAGGVGYAAYILSKHSLAVLPETYTMYTDRSPCQRRRRRENRKRIKRIGAGRWRFAPAEPLLARNSVLVEPLHKLSVDLHIAPSSIPRTRCLKFLHQDRQVARSPQQQQLPSSLPSSSPSLFPQEFFPPEDWPP